MENEVLLEGQDLAVATTSGLTGGQKAAIIVGASLLTIGTAYGVYRLVKLIKARRAAKANQPEETHE